MLTAADVEQKTFSTALRGYDLDEVDDFLDEVVATIRGLTEQLESAQKGPLPAAPVTAPEPEPVSAPTGVAPAALDESAIGRALLAAQTAADQLLADARDQATKIVSDAQGEADTWNAEKEAKRVEAEAEIAALAGRVNSIRSELAVLAGEVSSKLDEMDAVIIGDPAAGLLESGEVVEMSEHMGEALHFEGDSDDIHDEEPDDSYEQPVAGAPVDEPEGGRDHLDEILTGVANDLQFGSSEDDEHEEDDDD